MDALLALREAIVHGAPIVERGESLVINDGTDEAVTLARSTKTPFKSSGGGHYTIDALWMQYLYKDLRHADFWKEYDKRGVSRVGAVIVSDKESVLLYLQGQYDGADHIDREFVSTTSGVTRVPASHGIVPSTSSGSGGAAGAVGADKVPNDAVAAQAAAYAAIRAEKPLRTRTSILDAPGFKNFGEIVFEFFKHQDAATTGGAGKPGSGAKRSRDKDGPSGGESKYPRVGASVFSQVSCYSCLCSCMYHCLVCWSRRRKPDHHRAKRANVHDHPSQRPRLVGKGNLCPTRDCKDRLYGIVVQCDDQPSSGVWRIRLHIRHHPGSI